LRIETAEITLVGDREQNQDRVVLAASRDAALLVVVDGMGGHAEGERAAQTAADALVRSFRSRRMPCGAPDEFLATSVAAAHDAVVALGDGLPIESKPRATCVCALVQQSRVWWLHVGDARAYLFRRGALMERTRDHSHVEALLQEGLITEDEVAGHPMRHYVEACLGGEHGLPDLDVVPSHGLEGGDVVLLCSDGFWSGHGDQALAGAVQEQSALDQWLADAAAEAVRAGTPYADNATAAALRFLAS
jgi:serine/threonine protein phosphatase PrpC